MSSETVQLDKGPGSNNSDEISSDESSSESSFPISSDSVDDSNGGRWSHSVCPGSKGSVVKSKERATTSKESTTTLKESGTKGKSVASAGSQKSTSEVISDSGIPLAGWNGSEITYFRMLHPIFGQNFCAISELLRTKSCFEVFEYAQHVADDATISKHSARERRLAGKKKKKSMR